MFNHKIALGKATNDDRMYIGKAYYQLNDYGKADTAFMKVSSFAPNFIPHTFMMRGLLQVLSKNPAILDLLRPSLIC